MRTLLFAVALVAQGCSPGTGGQLVQFSAEAVGTPEAQSFTTPRGYAVSLSRAQLFVGALYLNQVNPSNYSEETSCVLPGIYSGEVRGGVTIDALSAEAQPFEAAGNGTDAPSRAAELWLTDGDVDAEDSKKVVLEVEGVATAAPDAWPFLARFTIGKNRALPPRNPALYGSNPICRQRIVTPIPIELTLAENATVRLRVDPREWFNTVEFRELTASPEQPGRFDFLDDSSLAGQPDLALYNGLRANKGPYAVDLVSLQ
jgi:hypothetical protein